MATSMNTTRQPSWKQKVVHYLEQKGKLELWSGVIGNQMVQNFQEEQAKNQAAEGEFVRRQLWGYTEPTASDEMNHTILGDVTIQPQQSSGALTKVLAGAAIAAGLMGIPAAGVIGYGVSQWTAEKPTTTEDTSLDLGLGRFEDLLPE